MRGRQRHSYGRMFVNAVGLRPGPRWLGVDDDQNIGVEKRLLLAPVQPAPGHDVVQPIGRSTAICGLVLGPAFDGSSTWTTVVRRTCRVRRPASACRCQARRACADARARPPCRRPRRPFGSTRRGAVDSDERDELLRTSLPTGIPTLSVSPTPAPTVQPTNGDCLEKITDFCSCTYVLFEVSHTLAPTPAPTTAAPSPAPTPRPSYKTPEGAPDPTPKPTRVPTPKPTRVPKPVPSPSPTMLPTSGPTEPTVVPTSVPTESDPDTRAYGPALGNPNEHAVATVRRGPDGRPDGGGPDTCADEPTYRNPDGDADAAADVHALPLARADDGRADDEEADAGAQYGADELPVRRVLRRQPRRRQLRVPRRRPGLRQPARDQPGVGALRPRLGRRRDAQGRLHLGRLPGGAGALLHDSHEASGRGLLRREERLRAAGTGRQWEERRGCEH